MFTTAKENNDSFITIRYAGQYIAIRDNITEAQDTITWNHWSIVERDRLTAARISINARKGTVGFNGTKGTVGFTGTQHHDGIQAETIDFDEEITMETAGNKLKVTSKTPRARALNTLTSSSNVLKVVRYLPLSN